MPKLYYKSGSNWVNALNIFYPVGAFYISNVSTSPGSLLGGTWAKVTNAAIRGATSTGYTGSDTHTLTVNEMPAHRHAIPETYNVSNGIGVTVPAWNSHYINTQHTDYSGGGLLIHQCSAPTTATFGTALPKRGWC